MGLAEQVELVRRYIRVGKYDEARDLLRTIDHPKSQEWLRKLDGMQSSVSHQRASSYSRLSEAEIRSIREDMRAKHKSNEQAMGCLMLFSYVVILSMIASIITDFSEGLFRLICTGPIFIPTAIWATRNFKKSRAQGELFK